MLLQGKIAISPAQPAAFDETIFNGGHLKSCECLTEGALVIREFRDFNGCVVRTLQVPAKSGRVRRLNRHVGRNADGTWLEEQIGQHGYTGKGQQSKKCVEALHSDLRRRHGSS